MDTHDDSFSFPSLFPLAVKVASRTIGMDLVTDKPMSAPTGELFYSDYAVIIMKITSRAKAFSVGYDTAMNDGIKLKDRYSNSAQKFVKRPPVPVSSMEDAMRRIDFRNDKVKQSFIDGWKAFESSPRGTSKKFGI